VTSAFRIISTSSAVIPSVIQGSCYVLKTVTPTETQSAAIAVACHLCCKVPGC